MVLRCNVLWTFCLDQNGLDWPRVPSVQFCPLADPVFQLTVYPEIENALRRALTQLDITGQVTLGKYRDASELASRDEL